MYLPDDKYVNAKEKRLREWMSKGLLWSARRKQSLSLKCKKHPSNVKLLFSIKNIKIILQKY